MTSSNLPSAVGTGAGAGAGTGTRCAGKLGTAGAGTTGGGTTGGGGGNRGRVWQVLANQGLLGGRRPGRSVGRA